MSLSFKKIIIIILASSTAVMFFSCKSVDPTLVTRTASFDGGVPPMRVVVNTESIRSCIKGGWRDHNEMVMEIRKWSDGYRPDYPGIYGYMCCSFPEQEAAAGIIRNNLMFNRDSKNAYLSVVVRNVEWYMNPGWMVPGSITAGILYLMGMPGASVTLTVDLEAAVMKPDGRILKVYKARGMDKEYLAMYWGYSSPEIPAYRNALVAGCADLRKQIEDDKENLKK